MSARNPRGCGRGAGARDGEHRSGLAGRPLAESACAARPGYRSIGGALDTRTSRVGPRPAPSYVHVRHGDAKSAPAGSARPGSERSSSADVVVESTWTSRCLKVLRSSRSPGHALPQELPFRPITAGSRGRPMAHPGVVSRRESTRRPHLLACAKCTRHRRGRKTRRRGGCGPGDGIAGRPTRSGACARGCGAGLLYATGDREVGRQVGEIRRRPAERSAPRVALLSPPHVPCLRPPRRARPTSPWPSRPSATSPAPGDSGSEAKRPWTRRARRVVGDDSEPASSSAGPVADAGSPCCPAVDPDYGGAGPAPHPVRRGLAPTVKRRGLY